MDLNEQIKNNIENIEEILSRITPWYDQISNFTGRTTGASVHFKRRQKKAFIGDIEAEAFWLLNGPGMLSEVKETLERVLKESPV